MPLALAIYSARTGLSLPTKLASSGELSFAGEIRRAVSHLKRREKTASEMGYSQFYAPVPGKEPEKIKKVLNNIFLYQVTLLRYFSAENYFPEKLSNRLVMRLSLRSLSDCEAIVSKKPTSSATQNNRQMRYRPPRPDGAPQ